MHSERKLDLIETLKLCDKPNEVFEKLRAIVRNYVNEGHDSFILSIDVKVYKPPKRVNKMVFRAVADEFVQGASLYEIWDFVNRYYSYASKYDKSLKYKGWKTYVSREVLKLVEMGYACTDEVSILRELVKSRKKLGRFKRLWFLYSRKISIKLIAEEIRKLPSRPSKKKLKVEMRGSKAIVYGLCSRSLMLDL
ncbi:MAG: hypothetical protein QW701_02820 [Candidatus Nezhaarchaeales archaeon]